ncbi:hypothetical protein FrEUN1fDRAFT_3271 [Parafrankia sp. EUN1f]|nr:hypothetical protein FrEUN1fDRAFT_3271 [Parafrankia sp. EUN1f]
MTLAGARPKGPRADLKDGPQKVLLTRLNELNNPYRVSYEMVARELWADTDPSKIQRSRTRDLSRQFRGEKAIEWQVVEIYVHLLFPDPGPGTERSELLEHLRLLHAEAFGQTVAPDGQPAPEADEPVIDAAYVAELSRQLDEARTRAAFATALLVIVQAENTALRGRGRSFDWFGTTARADQPAPPNRTRRRATASGSGSGSGGRVQTDPIPAAGSDASSIDPVTAPIARRQAYRAAQRRRSGSPAGSGEALPPGHRAASANPVVPTPSTSYSLAALTRYRPAPASPRRLPGTEVPPDDLGPDILVGREKRRRGRPR